MPKSYIATCKVKVTCKFQATARSDYSSMKIPEIRELPNSADADFGCVRAQIKHKHKDVTRDHECKNMTECRNDRY